MEATAPEPTYGAAAEMTGVWSRTFEHSNFSFCDGWETCDLNRQGCWFEATEQFWREFEQRVPADPTVREASRGGSFLIQFEGRVARNGPFGHLSQYSCQVEGIDLQAAERDPLR